MADVTFTDGSSPITISAPRYPEVPGRSLPQIVGITTGGRHVVADYGDGSVWERMVLNFRFLTATDKNSLKTFLETTVNWHETLFSYTDPHGTTHTNMRYMGGWREAQAGKGDRWDVTLVIQKDMSA